MINHPEIGCCFYHRQEGSTHIAVIPLTLGRARIILAEVGALGPYCGW